MRLLRRTFGTYFVAVVLSAPLAHAASKAGNGDYITESMPPGFQVVITEIEGPVFADSQGKTFYKWPKRPLRNGDAGEVQGKPACGDVPNRVNAGLMSPYPAGLELPEADTRPACSTVWPPVLAASNSKPVGKWTIVDRPDGKKQWAYDGWSLYTSVLDLQSGDTFGGTAMFTSGEVGAGRMPVGPEPNVPSQFRVETVMMGRMVVQRDGWAIYTYDGDKKSRSNCYDECLEDWQPILAPGYTRPLGEWTTFERSPGVKQWAFRGQPVYRHMTDQKLKSQDGTDVPGWKNVYIQQAPQPPTGFKMKDVTMGVALADASGKTVYRYGCRDDAQDQLDCDHPDAAQAFRFTVCGGGDPERCVKAFPYILAPVGAKSGSRVWGTMYIDPKTGKAAQAGQAGALHVWTFRNRPVYTFYDDKTELDVNANNWGEFNGSRNGYKTIVYRDLFLSRDE